MVGTQLVADLLRSGTTQRAGKLAVVQPAVLATVWFRSLGIWYERHLVVTELGTVVRTDSEIASTLAFGS